MNMRHTLTIQVLLSTMTTMYCRRLRQQPVTATMQTIITAYMSI